MADQLKFTNPEAIAKPPGYTHVVEVTTPGRLVYISGQLGMTQDGKYAGGDGDFAAQAAQAFENVKSALAAAGGGFEHVVKITNFLVDAKDLPAFRAARDRYVNAAAPPASTTIVITALARPGALFEVEAIAVLPVN